MKSKQQKQSEAGARALSRAALTPAQQLRALDARLGVNVGATRERAKLREDMRAADHAERATLRALATATATTGGR